MASGGPVGRFAPSPTGRLHIGSLLAAVGSFCHARHSGGRWLVRMEDLDPPREVPGAADDILRTLEGFGLHWDGEVVYQSTRHDRYAEALEGLKQKGFVYSCGCSRRDWAHLPDYPGTCRDGVPKGREARLERHRLSGEWRAWKDRFRGKEAFDTSVMGDFPVLRADGLWAYQLAVVVDDRDQGITEVIRGADLLDSTPRQMDLWAALSSTEGERAMPEYGHLPILQTAAGQKLSKQTFARPLEIQASCTLIDLVWGQLGQEAPPEWRDAVSHGDPEALMGLAVHLWQPDRVPVQPVQLHGWGQDVRPPERESPS